MQVVLDESIYKRCEKRKKVEVGHFVIVLLSNLQVKSKVMDWSQILTLILLSDAILESTKHESNRKCI